MSSTSTVLAHLTTGVITLLVFCVCAVAANALPVNRDAPEGPPGRPRLRGGANPSLYRKHPRPHPPRPHGGVDRGPQTGYTGGNIDPDITIGSGSKSGDQWKRHVGLAKGSSNKEM
ncbi:hypothetical protein CKM354_001020300 [Cercospora kikuchii]|uniref:Uncharacterized protein n=1 Tax=Cercospora kikuchii TaxID=84275 RepID=A0A9P3FGW9_9PEZI|nr:uncharacterized protein CKM354_001020300 [Cercospora kikuchii]GIZ47103.1 hypothetical protein CKM354_001020300 [Cercospora kikuchii]